MNWSFLCLFCSIQFLNNVQIIGIWQLKCSKEILDLFSLLSYLWFYSDKSWFDVEQSKILR